MSLDRTINRRTVFKGAGGLAAASIIGAGAAWSGVTPAHAEGLEVVNHETDGRMETYEFVTPSVRKVENPSVLAKKFNPSVTRNPRVNVLLPDNYSSGKRYPVLYLFHGGAGAYDFYDKGLNIRELTAGRELIVVMPDAAVGWHCDPVKSLAGPRNWETFHMKELLPWVDATFRTFPEQAGRAVSGFSMGGFGALKYTAKYYGHFASVSSHSGPASLRSINGAVAHWANASSTIDLGGGTVYGTPWDEARVSADNPVERIESYRGKRIFLVSGTEAFDVNEGFVLPTQREFAAALDRAGIQYERHEEPGGHFVRRERLQQDIDGIIAHLRKAG